MVALLDTLKARAVARNPADDPDMLHGLLMLAELRAPMRVVADAIGASDTVLHRILARARDGEAGRQRAHYGSGLASDVEPERAVAASGLAAKGLLFCRAWHREALLAMLNEGGATTRDLLRIMAAADVFNDLNKAIVALRKSLGAIGVGITMTSRGNSVTYAIEGEGAAKLRAVIAKGWRL